MAEQLHGIPQVALTVALERAGLRQGDLKTGPHFDSGEDCLYLEADIQQYSGFLAALAVQYRTVDDLLPLTSQVQLQIGLDGGTRFWLPGVQACAVAIPKARTES